jgi:hypothetical protein
MTSEHLDLEMEQQTDRSIQLTATLSNGQVVISGNGGANLPARSGSHRFLFSLNDQTGLGVAFSSLDAADNCNTCPPPSGMNSQQLQAVNINGTSAAFTDSNSGGAMQISYQWNFSCNDPSKLPIKYDPIINNGGSNAN